MQENFRQTCRQLIADGAVQVVIGYGQTAAGDRVVPVFITRPEDADQLVWNDQCFANLSKYLLRKEVAALGRAAICVKGCDQRALLVLEKESQIDRSQITVIGLACDGVGKPRRAKCESCDVHAPRQTDVVMGASNGGRQRQRPPDDRYAEIEAFLKKSPGRRPMAFWKFGVKPLREMLCLPAGLPHVLLPAVHCRQVSPRRHQHFGDA